MSFLRQILTSNVDSRSESVKSICCFILRVNPFKPEFNIIIFIQYKPRIAVAIYDL